MKRKDRIGILQKEMESRGLSAALISGEVNRHYLTFAGIGAGALLVTGNDAVFFTDSRFIDHARESVRG